jgi:putative addiction module killer protein
MVGSVIELRFHFGPGYRIYATKNGDVFLLLLIGGDKSTQTNDIVKARRLAEEWRKGQ